MLFKTHLKERRRVFYYAAQGGVCSLQRSLECRQAGGLMLSDVRRSPRRATWDHVITRADGGGLDGNILLACSQCNGERGNKFPAAEGAADRAVEIWAAWLPVREAIMAEFEAARAAKRKQRKIAKEAGRAFAQTKSATFDLEDDQARREARATPNER